PDSEHTNVIAPINAARPLMVAPSEGGADGPCSPWGSVRTVGGKVNERRRPRVHIVRFCRLLSCSCHRWKARVADDMKRYPVNMEAPNECVESSKRRLGVSVRGQSSSSPGACAELELRCPGGRAWWRGLDQHRRGRHGRRA